MFLRDCHWLATVALFLIAMGVLPGCGGKEDRANDGGGTDKGVGAGKTSANADAALSSTLAQREPRLHQAMKEAVTFEPPDEQLRPPDETHAKKSVGKIFDAIVGKDGVGGLWDQVLFVTADGKRLRYAAILKTDLGDLHLELWPEVAPNHVRNFVALARAGYFNGLPFHRAVSQQLDGKSLTYLEAGCPMGTGEIGYGSIGYWLKPEYSDETHVEGTVGASHAEEPDTAACKFYVTLGKAPYLDKHFTVFGQVTRGLDVARKVFALPTRQEPDSGESDQPEKPVVIRRVIIRAAELEKVARN